MAKEKNIDALQPSETDDELSNSGASGLEDANVTNELDLNHLMTAESISVDNNAPVKPSHPNDVIFKVKYPSNWEGEKTMQEGSVHVVSKESAAHFISVKIGNIVK